MNVCLKTLGCRLNEAELEHWAAGFRAEGCRLSHEPEGADLIVINTCAVTREATRKSRQLIRRSQRVNPRAKLVVSGCYSSLEADGVAAMEGVDLIVPNRDKDRLVARVREELSPAAMPALATVPAEPALFARGRNRAFIKVQDGCRYRCTFCIVTVARGAERSRALGDIVDEINALHEQDIREVVLTGVHIGGYGSDIDSNLTELIRTVLAETDVPRLRLGSVEPWDLGGEFLSLFENPRLMPHLHLPLQSGSDTVLRRMARRCKTAEFRRLVEAARAAVPDFNVTTDIIVGFPGETEAEWREGLDFIRDTGFSHIHIFPYSARAGTRAATLPDPVPPAVRRQRLQELHEAARAMKRDYARGFIGRQLPVLAERQQYDENTGETVVHGYTPNYLRASLRCPGAGDRANQILPARLTDYDDGEECLLALMSKE
jgi:threonylcarbamoyladenosine tRNA methylthiotransferase MtaB